MDDRKWYKEKREFDKGIFGDSFSKIIGREGVRKLIDRYRGRYDVQVISHVSENLYQYDCLFVQVYERSSGKCLFYAWGCGIDFHNGEFIPYFDVSVVGNDRFSDDTSDTIPNFWSKTCIQLRLVKPKARPFRNNVYEELKSICGNDLDWAISEGLI
uniref:Uncharacterized protein n=1 Tax=viral metagenome TaxID=1070528 RepID=A0A6H1ZA19_9ZZZZ